MSDPDFGKAHESAATAMWRTEATARLKLLQRARNVIVGLADQQAMPDDSYLPTLNLINKVLKIGGLE